MISYRNLNTIVVVDRESKKIVWKANMTIGQHNVHMLPVGVPGTGNVLVFDNGGIPPNSNPQRVFARPNSRVLEINPLTMAMCSPTRPMIRPMILCINAQAASSGDLAQG